MTQDPSASAPLAALACPVCRARFRGTVVCSRCKTDLSPLMRIAARAWAAREQSRAALLGGNLTLAVRQLATAQRLHRTGNPPDPAAVPRQ